MVDAELVDAGELAGELGLRRPIAARRSPSQAAARYRDMRSLQLAGFPIGGNAGDGYRLAQESYLRPLALDEAEAEALAVAARALAASGHHAALATATATAKLHAALGPTARRRVAQLEARIAVLATARASAPTPAMLEAIREHRAAAIAARRSWMIRITLNFSPSCDVLRVAPNQERSA